MSLPLNPVWLTDPLSASLCSIGKTLLSFNQHDPSHNANALISGQCTLFLSLNQVSTCNPDSALFHSSGVLCLAILPGPDACAGTLTESHSPGSPPAPVPQDVWTALLYRPPHETLSPPLNLLAQTSVLVSTVNTHKYTRRRGDTALTQPKHPATRRRATKSHL